jgi:hypothetical protein
MKRLNAKTNNKSKKELVGAQTNTVAYLGPALLAKWSAPEVAFALVVVVEAAAAAAAPATAFAASRSAHSAMAAKKWSLPTSCFVKSNVNASTPRSTHSLSSTPLDASSFKKLNKSTTWYNFKNKQNNNMSLFLKDERGSVAKIK